MPYVTDEVFQTYVRQHARLIELEVDLAFKKSQLADSEMAWEIEKEKRQALTESCDRWKRRAFLFKAARDHERLARHVAEDRVELMEAAMNPHDIPPR